MQRRQTLLSAALVGADVAVLALARPDFGRLSTDLAAPHAWFARTGVDGALADLAAAGLWLAAAWLAVGLVAAASTRLPGTAGRIGVGVAGVVLPGVVRGVLAGGLGLGVLLTPLAAGAAAPPANSGVDSVRVVSAVDLPGPGWPTSADPQAAERIPAPTWPVEHHPDTDADRPAMVHRGDSLWVIAARRLGPHATPADVAAAWPRWYAANRDVIGDDPGLIVPGQVLHAPAVVTEENR